VSGRLSLAASSFAVALLLGTSAIAAPLDKGDESGKLADAVRADDQAAIKTLLAQGASPNQILPDTTTPLFIAIDHQNIESVRLLIAAGAKADAKDQDGNSPLLLACLLGNADIVSQLLDAHADMRSLGQGQVPPFALCAGSSSSAILGRMIAAGQDVDQASAEGQSALMYAASYGQSANIGTLLRHGAKVNATSKKGYSPIMFAMRGGSSEAVQALIKGGADVSHVTPDGATALQIALEDRNVAFATLLVNNGASLQDNWDLHGRTPLQLAVLSRNADLVKLMLSKGADPNAPSRLAYGLNPNDISFHPSPGDHRFDGRRKPIDYAALGYTPRIMLHTNPDGGGPAAMPPAPTVALLLAASTGQANLMKVLVEGGGDAKFTNADGLNIVLASALGRKIDAVTYAHEVGPEITLTRKDGNNALHLALGGNGAGGAGGGGGGLTEDETFQVVKYFVDQGVSIDAVNSRGQTPLAMALDRGDKRTQALFKQIVAERAAKAHSGPRVATALKPARNQP